MNHHLQVVLYFLLGVALYQFASYTFRLHQGLKHARKLEDDLYRELKRLGRLLALQGTTTNPGTPDHVRTQVQLTIEATRPAGVSYTYDFVQGPHGFVVIVFWEPEH